MSRNRVLCKASVGLFGFLLCLGVLLVSGLFPVRAAMTQKGVVGDCTWEYAVEDSGDVTFRLYPTNGVEGTASWTKSYPPWCENDLKSFSKNVTRVIIDKPVKLTSAAGMFSDFQKARVMDLSGLITDDVKDFKQMFYDCYALTSLDLGGLKTNSATDMTGMFQNCVSLEHLNVAGWEMGSVAWLNFTFQNCKRLEKIDGMKTWTWNSGGGFSPQTESIPGNPSWSWGLGTGSADFRSKFKLQEMESIFEGCSALREVDASCFRTDDVTTMRRAFKDCQALSSLDVSSWNVGKLEDLYETFCSCRSLKEIRGIDRWKASSLKNIARAFFFCASIRELNLNKWNVSKCTDFSELFCRCYKLERIEVNEWDTKNVTSFYGVFANSGGELEKLDVSKWDVSNATSLDYTFSFARYESGAFPQNPNDFKNFGKVRELDISGPGWKTNTNNMRHFIASGELSVLKIANGVSLKHKLALSGLNVTGWKSGQAWQYVDVVKGGNTEAPRGPIFFSSENLRMFHSQLANSPGFETYVRVSTSQHFIFDKNSPDATGEMDPQIIFPNTTGKIKASSFSYPGHRVVSWNTRKDGTGKRYDIGEAYTNTATESIPIDTIYGSLWRRPIVLYAQWETGQYNIVFDSNAPEGTIPSGTMPPKNGIAYGEKIKLPKNNFRIPGYDFAGWTLNREGTGTFYADEEEVSNLSSENGITVTLYAQWVKGRQDYTINFDRNDPEKDLAKGSMEPLRVEYGQDVTIPKSTFTCPGYEFVGWSRTPDDSEDDFFADGATVKNLVVEPSANAVTLYAQWIKLGREYTIWFEGNGPSGTTVSGSTPPVTARYGEEVSLSPNGFTCRDNTRAKYVFLCWMLDKNGASKTFYRDKQKVKNLITRPSQAGVYLYAQWIKNDQQYEVIFDPNYPSGAKGDTSITMRPERMKYGVEKKLDKNLYTCEGHVFLGWSRKKKATKDDFFKDEEKVKDLIVAPPFTEVTLYAQWIRIGQDYKIVFDRNTPSGIAATDTGGQMDDVLMKYGESKPLPPNAFTVKNHTFLGWGRKQTTTEDDLFRDKQEVTNLVTDPPFNEVKLYAHWKKSDKTVKLTYKLSDPEGGILSPAEEKIASSAGTVTGTTLTLKDGYQLAGWKVEGTEFFWGNKNSFVLAKEVINLFARENGVYKDTTFIALVEKKNPPKVIATITIKVPGEPDQTKEVEVGKDFELPPLKVVPAGKTLKGIEIDGKKDDLKQPGDTIAITKSVTITYVLKDSEKTVKLTYKLSNPEGATLSSTEEMVAPNAGTVAGTTVTLKDKYRLVGWKVEGAGFFWGSKNSLVLPKEVINLFAKENGVYKDTTFIALVEEGPRDFDW